VRQFGLKKAGVPDRRQYAGCTGRGRLYNESVSSNDAGLWPLRENNITSDNISPLHLINLKARGLRCT